MERIKTWAASIKLSRKQVCRNLAVFPLLASDPGEPFFLTLDEALAQKAISLTEKSSSGTVSELRLVNSQAKPVLILEGEELMGAKQNRIINATFLIAGNTELEIPVSCVEQGRWNYTSPEFRSGEKLMPASLRQEHQVDLACGLELGLGYRSNQGKIWNKIQQKSKRMKSESDTGAMDIMFENHQDQLADFSKTLRVIELQVGAVFFINGRPAGLDLFCFPDTWAKFFDKLVKSYALDALDWMEDSVNPTVSPFMARRFLTAAMTSPGKGYPSVGLGENLRFDSRQVNGAALIVQNQVLHLSAFSKNENRPGHESRPGGEAGYARFSKRRKNAIHGS
ncbi:MAG: hypothetical protein HQK55_11465 [Deltaproteobacteria bacterium]|nr:hypothetical protein [Deltaproteobacteria bacterium]